MKIRFILIGKVKDLYLKDAYEEYMKRLSRFAEISVEYISESSINLTPSDAEIKKALDDEAKRVLKTVKPGEYKIVLDLHGKMLSSEEFAGFFVEKENTGNSSFVFIVGSSYGLSDLLIDTADYRLCLSKMTFTHPFALLLILEQVYRAFKINANETYHK